MSEFEIGASKADDDSGFSEVTGLDELRNRLDAMENKSLGERNHEKGSAVAGMVTPRKQGAQTPSATRPKAGDAAMRMGAMSPAEFTRTMFELWTKRQTGALVTRMGGRELEIYFEEGRPVWVENSLPGDNLGASLVASGRVTDADYSVAAKHAIERGTRIADAFLQLGKLTEAHVAEEMKSRAKRWIVECFADASGSYEFEPNRRWSEPGQRFALNVGELLFGGFRNYATDPEVENILGPGGDGGYYRLRGALETLRAKFPIDTNDGRFLELGSRAYNLRDAAEAMSVPIGQARRLMCVLQLCAEVEAYTPGVQEFEARIREERERLSGMRTGEPQIMPEPAPRTFPSVTAPAPAMKPAMKLATSAFSAAPRMQPSFLVEDPMPVLSGEAIPLETSPPGTHAYAPTTFVQESPRPPKISYEPEPEIGIDFSSRIPLDEPDSYAPSFEIPIEAEPEPVAIPAPPPLAQARAPMPAPDPEIPPMPVPLPGQPGGAPAPLAYAKAQHRTVDGGVVETPERSVSREHFQRAVGLLGQGEFHKAEQAFREAVALCSDEHVYLIGLARSIFYNPEYYADAKLPILKGIVARAEQMAPDDKRVIALSSWIRQAEWISLSA
jgi:hypothetical protein